jgi:D-alanyl-D-alanine endopeptidase (penicillin-binding protein 7)
MASLGSIPLKYLVALLFAFTANVQALTARSFIVTDMEGNVIMQMNSDEKRSIASITKLFVAEQAIKLDPTEEIMVTKEDLRNGRMRSSPLRAGQSYTRHQLTELALVPSDNVAAIALGRSSPPVTSLATLVESSGLNPANQSTAHDLAEAARLLYLTEIGDLSTHTTTEIGQRHSTNPLLAKEGWHFFLSKTGFINDSGGCLVVVLQVKDQTMTIAILGASNTKERWQDLIEVRRMLGDSDFYVPIKVTKVIKRKRKKVS